MTERADAGLNMEYIKPFIPKQPKNDNIKANRARYYETHKEEIKQKGREYSKQKYHNDPEFRARALARFAEYRKALKQARLFMTATTAATTQGIN
jgi:hypothetical protein